MQLSKQAPRMFLYEPLENFFNIDWSRWRPADILDLVQAEVAPFDPPRGLFITGCAVAQALC